MAKRNIGGVFLDIILRDEKFTTKMRAAGKLLKSESRNWDKALAQTARYAAQTGAVMAGAFAGGVYLGVEAVDKLAKESDKLGISTETMGALTVAAQLSGVEVETVAKAMAKASRLGIEAAQGSTSAADALGRLGIKAEDFNRLNPEQQLGLVADRLNTLENANERAAAATDIFGKSGRDLLPLLAGGSQGLEDARKEAELFGLAISRPDAAQVEIAADAIDRVKLAGQGLFQQLAVQLSPAIAEVGEWLVKVLKDWGGMGSIADRVIHNIIGGIGVITTAFDKWEKVFAGINVVIAWSRAAWVAFLHSLAKIAVAIPNLFVDIANAAIKASNAISRLNGGKQLAEIGKFTALVDGTGETMNELRMEAIKAEQALNAALTAKPAHEVMLDTLDAAKAKFKAQAVVIADNSKKLSGFAKVEEDATAGANKHAAAQRGVAAALKAVNLEMLGLSDIASRANEGSENARFAAKAADLYDQAHRAEASGNYEYASKLFEQAEKAAGKVRRRPQVSVGGDVGQRPATKEEIARAEAAKRAEMLAEEYARDKAEGHTMLPPGSASTPAPSRIAAEGSVSRSGSSTGDLLAKLEELIATLNGLPARIGVA